MMVALLGLGMAGAANATVIFSDNFDSLPLPPEWLISPGKSDYSLTANPGSLRYTIDAYQKKIIEMESGNSGTDEITLKRLNDAAQKLEDYLSGLKKSAEATETDENTVE